MVAFLYSVIQLEAKGSEVDGGVKERLHGFLFLATLVIILLSIILFIYSQKGLDGLGEMAGGLFLMLIWVGAVKLYGKLFKK